MGKFLDDFLLTMPETQRQKLMELLEMKRRSGYIKSDYELKIELDRLIKELDQKNGKPTFQPRYQSEQTDSASYNHNLEEIAFDLSALFQVSNTVDQLLTDNQQLSRSLLHDIRKKIHLLGAKIEKYKLFMGQRDKFIQGVYEQFQVPQYTETLPQTLSQLRKGRYGEDYSELFDADVVAGALNLSSVETVDQLKTNYGAKLARIEVRNRIGNATTNPKHTIDYAIDGSQETFWAESVLMDDVISSDIQQVWNSPYDDAHYPKNGALCDIEIILNGLTTVSEVQFDPYCAYPLEIVSIYGYESADPDAKRYKLVSPDHSNPHQRSKKSVNLMSFQFPSVDISRLRILICQENYAKENFLVNRDEENQRELWQRVAMVNDHSMREEVLPGESIEDLNRQNQISGWTRYLRALESWAHHQGLKARGVVEAAKNALQIVQTGDFKNPMLLSLQALLPNQPELPEELKVEWKPVKKHEYLYGAYNISVFGRKYKDLSVYITKPLPLAGNVKNVTLATDEANHELVLEQGDSVRITDIEYYITYQKNPSMEDWKPILPTNKPYVQGELLIGNDVSEDYPELAGTIQFTFRFPIVSSSTVKLRRNGKPMSPITYLISDDGTRIGIKKEYYMASSVYTVDYKPMDQAYYVSLEQFENIEPVQYMNDNGEIGEFFAAVDNNHMLELKHTPYLYRPGVMNYQSDAVGYQIEEGNLQPNEIYYPVIVRVNGEEYQNITDYTQNTFDKERLYNEQDGKVFAQIGRKIYFPMSEKGESLTNIQVDYSYISTDIRMKAILRRNIKGHDSITPSLYNWSLSCQTFDQEVKNV